MTATRWLQEITAACSRRLLARYTVLYHNARRCRVRLALAASEADVAALPAVQARAERTVIELLGPTTKITKVSFDDDQLIDLAVSHEAGTKLAVPQYRHRIERVISTMLPGRWRAHWDLEADTVRFEVRPAMPTKVDHPTPVLTKEQRGMPTKCPVFEAVGSLARKGRSRVGDGHAPPEDVIGDSASSHKGRSGPAQCVRLLPQPQGQDGEALADRRGAGWRSR